MFFTETSRRKGAERNGPTKVIRIHLQGLIPDYSQLIISALCSGRTPRDHIISILHIHYATNGNTIIKQLWYSGTDKTSVPNSSALKSIQLFSTDAIKTWGKLQADSFHRNHSLIINKTQHYSFLAYTIKSLKNPGKWFILTFLVLTTQGKWCFFINMI